LSCIVRRKGVRIGAGSEAERWYDPGSQERWKVR
jgi:hypothetical protein